MSASLQASFRPASPFTPRAVADYLSRLHRAPVTEVRVAPMSGGRQGDKGYGYGAPLRVDYRLAGQPRRAVIESVRAGGFGHEHMADRAQIMLWSHHAAAGLPRHVRSLDVGAVRPGARLEPLGDAEEFFIVTEFVDGREYADDLLRLRAGGALRPLDLERADALCDYLATVHSARGTGPGLYARRIRELLGHGECIFGICDSYPERFAPRLEKLEASCVAWRWKLKTRSQRLRQVHGDFHPWNILFREDIDFSTLDRSRGEWGEAADDVACLALNYLFFSLQRCGRLEGSFEVLWTRFWQRYLERSRDLELLDVAAPFIAWRCLVMANPVWYPSLDEALRGRLLGFAGTVLAAERFEPERANEYLGA